MLIEKKEVVKMLRCPKSGVMLREGNNVLVAEFDGEKVEYELIDGYPVLIDFKKSVLKKEDIGALSSVIERRSYSGLLGIAKRLVSPTKKVTSGNVGYLLDILLKGKDSALVLIVGGGSIGKGMNPLYDDPRIALVSFDIYASPEVQFLADAHNIPLPDNTFDAVVIQAVLEHVLMPSKVVSEIHRVLKKDGIVYAETPFLQHVHEGAYDFTRFTESGHRYLFRKFELIKSGASAGTGTQLLWSIDYFFRGLFRSRKIGKLAKLCFFWLQYCDKIIPDAYNIDSASGVFLLGRKKSGEISAKEIIAHYKGAQN